MLPLLVALTVASWSLADFTPRVSPTPPEWQQGDSQLVETTVGAMRHALWYREQYIELEDYVEDLEGTHQALLIDYHLQEDYIGDLGEEITILRRMLERWRTTALITGGVALGAITTIVLLVIF